MSVADGREIPYDFRQNGRMFKMNGPRFRHVGLFVDWNSQLREVPLEFADRPIDKCKLALTRVGKIVTKHLCNLDASSVFRVQIRLYHGWTAGVTQTPNRRAFDSIAEVENLDEIFPSTRVLALSDVEFGDRLIDALPRRLKRGLQIHLPNTYRRQRGDAEPAEKMVDTALASDLLSWARSDPTSIAVVFSNDDDAVPAVLVAEAWMKPFGGEVYLVRSNARGDSRYLVLEGLLL
ncbi:hypothetical protein JQ628_24810 [Bradyrhizobium lablabi]|uniref:hypothetical protein n=1 Tax=Bradyrhizobium lablabi TaxID=722472 RepID=UPI001BAA07D2|nr:hypothetical protein [Bradyrhizobium lablabi]MBR1124768.1 hypothetical protein [Bradyrhizobium lablabi]